MSLSDEIKAIEARVHALSLPMSYALDKAGVHRSLWSFWKSGARKPPKANWEKLVATVCDLEKRLTE